jgi:hypothetical protein
MPRSSALLAALLTTLLAGPLHAPAPAKAGELTGVLFGGGQELRYALPDLEVQFCDQAGACYSAVTGSDGWFRVPDIPAGTYNVVTASKMGTQSAGIVEVPPAMPSMHVEIVTP